MLAEVDATTLARTEPLGTDNDFRNIVPLARRTIQIIKSVLDSPHRIYLAYQHIKAARACAEQIKRIFQEIYDFTLTDTPNPRQKREKLQSALSQQYDTLYSTFSAFLMAGDWETRAQAFTTDVDFKVTARLSDVDKKLNELQQQATYFQNTVQVEIDSKLSRVDGKIGEIEKSTAKLGVAKHAVHFQKEANRNKASSNQWLRGVVLSSIAIVGIVIWNVASLPSDVVSAIPRAVSVAFLWTIAAWCSKNRRAEEHQYTVNQHKANSLSSFETFIAASGDQETKNAVLVSATNNIFGHQPSGYGAATGRSPDLPPPNKIVHVHSRDIG